MCGYDSTPNIYKPIKDFESSYSGCTKNANYSSVTYTPTSENTSAKVTYDFVATEAAEYYFYTPSNNPKECKIEVNGKSLGKYLGNDTRHIFSLGWYEAGENVTVTISLQDDPLNIVNNCNYIWYIDRDVFEQCFADLSDNPQLEINDGFTDAHLTGTITTTQETTNIMTTITYDDGWQIYIDGKKTEIYKSLDALIAFDVDGVGEHTVELKYMPPIYKLGMIMSISGITIFFVICCVDFVLKKTLLKTHIQSNVENYWTLEDFDDDNEQYLQLPDEELPQRKPFKERIACIFKKKK